MPEEEWRSVVGWEDRYLISSTGRVWSVVASVEMSLWVNQDGYDQVGLRGRGSRKQRLVHRLVCEAFHGSPPPDKPLALHGANGKRDNSPENVRWGSNSDNMRDRVAHGTDPQVNKTHCPQGHPYDAENTHVYTSKSGRKSRGCIPCNKERAYKARRTPLPPDDPRHGRVSSYSGRNCRCEPCKEAYSEYGKRWRSGKSKA